jgi:hypothetical protein
MGQRACRLVRQWGPERFAQGAMEAIDLANRSWGRRGALLLKGVN